MNLLNITHGDNRFDPILNILLLQCGFEFCCQPFQFLSHYTTVLTMLKMWFRVEKNVNVSYFWTRCIKLFLVRSLRSFRWGIVSI